jgi:hypothetical protein
MKYANAAVSVWVCSLGLFGSEGIAAAAKPGSVPDLNGVWTAVESPSAFKTTAGKLPPLLPEAKKLYEANIASRKASKKDFDGTARCQAPAMPRALIMGMPFEIQQEPNQVHFLFQWNRLFRSVELNITHEQQNAFAPYFFGWSVGKWDGGALKIDSVLFDDTTVLDEAGLPHSMDLHLTETWALAGDSKTLNASFTFEDPAYYSAPWTTTLRFKRLPAGTEAKEDICLERLGLVTVK